MKYCNKCRAQIAGERSLCPLCGSELIRQNDEVEEVFPVIPTVYKKNNMLFRILIFASVVAAVVSVLLNVLVPGEVYWSFFVVIGIGSMWLSMAIAVRKRRNIPKNIMYQVVLLSLLGLLWDRLTGWNGWSMEYVIPIACMAALISLSVVSRILRLEVEDYVVYIMIDALLGIVPLLLLLLGKLNVTLPSLLCIAGSVICIAGLLLFSGKRLFAELKRRLHI